MIEFTLSAEGRIERLYGDALDRAAALRDDPGLHNVLGYEREFNADPVAMDFLDPHSRFHHLKQLSTRLYLDWCAPLWARIPSAAAALDAGCGIGRFTIPLAGRFAHVAAFDPCRSAIDCCIEHLRRAEVENAAVHWADQQWLRRLPDASFDVIWAIEFLCYTTDPAGTLAELTRLARPGAWLLCSVESLPGGLCGQDHLEVTDILEALAGRPILLEEDSFVHLFDGARLCAMVERCGWRPVELAGSHYFGEGPFWQSIDDDLLAETRYQEQLLTAERVCRADPRLRDLGRVLCLAARKAE